MADPANNPTYPDPAAAYAPQPTAAGYPPQDPAYPQQQQGYPDATYPAPQQGYPPQGYPPQVQPPQDYPPQGYPPQPAPAYPPQQGYAEKQPYPSQPYPQQGAPPPYSSQTESTNVVVVQQQPQTVMVQSVRHYGTGDHGLLYAILASICVFFCGTWCSLFCTIPAIFISLNAQDAERRGDDVQMLSQAKLSRILSSVGIFFSVGFWVLYIIVISVSA